MLEYDETENAVWVSSLVAANERPMKMFWYTNELHASLHSMVKTKADMSDPRTRPTFLLPCRLLGSTVVKASAVVNVESKLQAS